MTPQLSNKAQPVQLKYISRCFPVSINVQLPYPQLYMERRRLVEKQQVKEMAGQGMIVKK